jgi:hypothetical protein
MTVAFAPVASACGTRAIRVIDARLALVADRG